MIRLPKTTLAELAFAARQLQVVGPIVYDSVVREKGVALEHHRGIALVGGQSIDGFIVSTQS